MTPKSLAAALTTGALVLSGLTVSTASAHHPPAPTPKVPTAVGYGGAVASVDADATNIGLSAA